MSTDGNKDTITSVLSGDHGNGIDYDVGYRKPPRHTRFQPGRSGNPRGRPKGAHDLTTRLQIMLGEEVSLHKDGMARRIRKDDAVLGALIARAARGEVAAARLIFAAVSERENREQARRTLAPVKNLGGEFDAMSDEELVARIQRLGRKLRDDGFDLFGDEGG